METRLASSEIRIGRGDHEVSGLLVRPESARWLYVFAHGAGAGMRHPFMAAMVGVLAARRVATLRYHFPYMEHGRRRPDSRPRLLATVRSAIREAANLAPDLPLIAGGKSMGGRMTSLALAEQPDERVSGIAFLGFPLHPAGRPSDERGAHLAAVPVPMLFLQGTRDALADLTLLTPLARSLGGRATLHVVEGADHSFHVLRRSGRRDDEVLEELGDTMAGWASDLEGIAG